MYEVLQHELERRNSDSSTGKTSIAMLVNEALAMVYSKQIAEIQKERLKKAME